MTWLTKTYKSTTIKTAVSGNMVAYHTTIAGSQILQEGFKTRAQIDSAALGGGADDAVSFTTEYSTAKGIFDAFILMWELANSSNPLEYIAQHSSSLDSGVYQQINNYMNTSFGLSIDDLISGWKKTKWNMSKGPLTSEELEQSGFQAINENDDRHFYWKEPINNTDIDNAIYSYVGAYLAFAPVYNPMFFGSSVSYFRNIPRDNIGIFTVELYLDPEKKGNQNKENAEYYVLPSMAEIRMRNLDNINIISFDSNPGETAPMSSVNLTYHKDEELHNDLNKIIKTIYKHRDIFSKGDFEFDNLVGIFQDIDNHYSLNAIIKQIYALIGIDYSRYDLEEYYKIKKRMEPDEELSPVINSLPYHILYEITNGEDSWENIQDRWYDFNENEFDLWYSKLNYSMDREIEYWLSDYRWNKSNLDKIVDRISKYHPIEKIDDFAEINEVFESVLNKTANCNYLRTKTAQSEEENVDWHSIDYDAKYPKSGAAVDGLIVREEVPNTESIGSGLYHYDILPGIRTFPMSDLGSGDPHSVFYAKDDIDRSYKLAEVIKQSKEINPLIVVIDDEGPYILEGGHRFAALYILGIMHFPALVVIDQTDWES